MIRIQIVSAVVAASAMVAAGAFAADAKPPVPAGVFGQKVLSAPLAAEAAIAAMAACNAQGFHGSVSVVDRRGDLRVQIYGDGARFASPESSRKKAYTSAVRGISSADYGKSLVGAAPAVAGAPLADVNMTAQTGGLPIIVDGDTLAGLGFSGDGGGMKDEGCAAAGIAKIKDRLK
jgi:uncharacterized protein GlcG (DUF336 family)